MYGHHEVDLIARLILKYKHLYSMIRKTFSHHLYNSSLTVLTARKMDKAQGSEEHQPATLHHHPFKEQLDLETGVNSQTSLMEERNSTGAV